MGRQPAPDWRSTRRKTSRSQLLVVHSSHATSLLPHCADEAKQVAPAQTASGMGGAWRNRVSSRHWARGRSRGRSLRFLVMEAAPSVLLFHRAGADALEGASAESRRYWS